MSTHGCAVGPAANALPQSLLPHSRQCCPLFFFLFLKVGDRVGLRVRLCVRKTTPFQRLFSKLKRRSPQDSCDLCFSLWQVIAEYNPASHTAFQLCNKIATTSFFPIKSNLDMHALSVLWLNDSSCALFITCSLSSCCSLGV